MYVFTQRKRLKIVMPELPELKSFDDGPCWTKVDLTRSCGITKALCGRVYVSVCVSSTCTGMRKTGNQIPLTNICPLSFARECVVSAWQRWPGRRATRPLLLLLLLRVNCVAFYVQRSGTHPGTPGTRQYNAHRIRFDRPQIYILPR